MSDKQDENVSLQSTAWIAKKPATSFAKMSAEPSFPNYDCHPTTQQRHLARLPSTSNGEQNLVVTKTAKKLTRKQKIFIAEYLVDSNATRAAKAAGYSKKTAEVIGSRLLRNVKVAAEIEHQTEKLFDRLEISAEKVLKELALMGFARMSDYISISERGDPHVDLSKLTPEQSSAIREITFDEYTEGKGDGAREAKRIRFKLGDKRGSLELLGRHLKLFTDKHEHTGRDGGPIALTGRSDEDLKFWAENGYWPGGKPGD